MASTGKPDLSAAFPLLNISNHRVTSPSTTAYNCIAWAAGEVDRWWWPDQELDAYWPDGAPREASLDAFVRAFQTLNYSICADRSFETGVEKVVLYWKDGVPTHAARQLSNGWWTSKLGSSADIEHLGPDVIEGEKYNRISIYLARPIAGVIAATRAGR